MVHLLSLPQVSGHEALPEVWKDLLRDPKRQNSVVLQQAPDMLARRFKVRVPTVVTAGILNMVLTLGFYLNQQDNL